MDKSTIRRKTLIKMKQDEPVFKQKPYQELYQSSVFQKANVIGLFENTKDETSTAPIIFRALAEGKKVVIPRTKAKKQMEYVLWTPYLPLQKTKFGIWEPVGGQVIDKDQINLIVVPGVAFTITGDRIGYGAGFFDRFLQDFKGNTVSLIRKCQLYPENTWEPDKFDISIDRIIH